MQSLINKFQAHGDLGPPMGCDPRAVARGCEPEAAPTRGRFPVTELHRRYRDYLQQANRITSSSATMMIATTT